METVKRPQGINGGHARDRKELMEIIKEIRVCNKVKLMNMASYLLATSEVNAMWEKYTERRPRSTSQVASEMLTSIYMKCMCPFFGYIWIITQDDQLDRLRIEVLSANFIYFFLKARRIKSLTLI